MCRVMMVKSGCGPCRDRKPLLFYILLILVSCPTRQLGNATTPCGALLYSRHTFTIILISFAVIHNRISKSRPQDGLQWLIVRSKIV